MARFGEGTGEALFAPSSLVMRRFRMRFDDHLRFTVTENHEGTGRHTARPEDVTGAWGEIPPELSTACGPSVLTLLVTSVVPAGTEPYALQVNTNGESLEPEVACDRCLIGTWQLDLASYAAGFDTLMAGFGSASLQDVQGSVEMTFSEGGYVSSVIQDLRVKAIVDFGGEEGIMEMSMAGSSSANYVVGPSGILTTLNPVEAILTDFRITIAGRTAETAFGSPPAPGVAGSYTCEGDRLHVVPLDVGVAHPGLSYSRTR
jgi:hypothetical protein